MTRIYVSRDSGALSMGAEAVAMAIATEAVTRNQPVTVVRNGSRGMFWLEPLVEVETPAGRVGYGPVKPADVASLFDAGFERGESAHALHLGQVESIPFFAKQERL